MRPIQKFTRLIGPMPSKKLVKSVDKATVSKSHKLFADMGLTVFDDGLITLSPFLLRSLRKLETVVRRHMDEVSATEILLPTLTPAKLLKTSDRIDIPELFKLRQNDGKEFILSPTNEESITSLLGLTKSISRNLLPLRLYQISKKFRNEKRAKFGLLRSKEFVMKDLYCFDSSPELSNECYEEVMNKYHQFFNLFRVPYVCVEAPVGNIGGTSSNEFHFLTDIGEDTLILCDNCGFKSSLPSKQHPSSTCPKCSSGNISIKNGIEVGHAFKLGTKYSSLFGAYFTNTSQKDELLHMTCFGLGLTRILAATVELLSSFEEIKWPTLLAPYLVCVIPPKAGSNEEKALKIEPEKVYESLNKNLAGEILFDDRTSESIGSRLLHAKKMGFPFIVVIGRSAVAEVPRVEVHDTRDGSVTMGEAELVPQIVLDKLVKGFFQSECVETCANP